MLTREVAETDSWRQGKEHDLPFWQYCGQNWCWEIKEKASILYDRSCISFRIPLLNWKSMRWTWIPIRTSFIMQPANTSTHSLSGTMIWWFMVWEARLSFHKGQIEQDLDFLKLQKTSPLREQSDTELQNLVRSTCQSSHFAVPLGAMREKVH